MFVPVNQRQEILDKYNSGITADALSKRYRVNPLTIKKTILDLGGRIRTKEEVSILLHPQPTEEEIAERIKEVQGSWDEETRRLRMGDTQKPVEIPVCQTQQRRRSRHNGSVS